MKASLGEILYYQEVHDFLKEQYAVARTLNLRGYLDVELTKATIRLRAARGEPLLEVGDSFNVDATQEAMAEVGERYGVANLRMFKD